jgi:predicted metal-binding membrane protein
VSTSSAIPARGLCAARVGQLRRAAWRYPDWWCLALSAGAWLVLLSGAATVATHPGHAGAPHAALGSPAHWVLMLLAMMLPLVRGPVRVTAGRSLWSRRNRAISGFLAGYLAVWTGAGAAALAAFAVAGTRYWLEPAAGGAVAFAVAALWQQTPTRRRALMACHRTLPLAPRGWRADRDCVRYGWTIGTACLVTCWPLMAACLFLPHSTVAMAGAGILAGIERYTPRPDQRMIRAGMVAAAVVLALSAVV